MRSKCYTESFIKRLILRTSGIITETNVYKITNNNPNFVAVILDLKRLRANCAAQ
jgi:hypothetical protein